MNIEKHILEIFPRSCRAKGPAVKVAAVFQFMEYRASVPIMASSLKVTPTNLKNFQKFSQFPRRILIVLIRPSLTFQHVQRTSQKLNELLTSSTNSQRVG